MIINKDLIIYIQRFKKSHNFKYNNDLNTFSNNIKNNMQDIFQLLRKNEIIFECKCQSIANHPEFDYLDSIQEGNFQIKCFVNSGHFHGKIHAIINTKDLAGQIIDSNAYQMEDGQLKGRWLIHDTWWKGKRLIHAWSGACIMIYPESLELLNRKFRQHGVNENYILNGELKEI